MKKRILSLSLAFAMALSLVTIPAAAAETATPATSSNILNMRYSGNLGNTICSYLFENQFGGLTRVEYHAVEEEPLIVRDKDGNIIKYQSRETPGVTVEEYDSNFQLTRSLRIAPELPIWGGFFAGQDYNFLIYGANNYIEDDNAEVIRVVKYTKDWKRVGHASVRGDYNAGPFVGGSLSCTEHDGDLYIHTCREEYKDETGKNHQSSYGLRLNIETMIISECYIAGASHSFNQFILTDSNGHVAALNHGDAHPRSIELTVRYFEGAYSGPVADYTILSFPGKVGDNATGAEVGGLAETTGGYVVAYCYDGTGGAGGTRLPYLGYVDKQSGQARNTLVTSTGASTPFLVPAGLGGGYMLWNGRTQDKRNTLYYLTYSADGTPGPIQTATAPLSDCQPIYYNGKVVWYTTNDSAPTFYTLDNSGVTATPAGGTAQPTQPEQPQQPTQPEQPGQSGATAFADVPTTHWAYPYVSRAAENGWVKGVGNNQFAPNETLTFAEFYTMVVPIFAADKLADYQPPAGSPWWQPYMWVGGEYLRANTIWWDTYYVGPGVAPNPDQKLQESINQHANEPITRADATSIMWRVMGEDNATHFVPDVEEARQKLLNMGLQLNMADEDTVSVCYAAGLISGNENGDLNLDGTLTRAEGCTMLCNLVDYMLEYGWMSGTGEYIPFQLPDLS